MVGYWSISNSLEGVVESEWFRREGLFVAVGRVGIGQGPYAMAFCWKLIGLLPIVGAGLGSIGFSVSACVSSQE